MFTNQTSNWRAVFFPMVLFGALLVLVVPAWGAVHLTDETGSGGTLFGAAMTELEDLNGDLRWEFLVGAPGAPNGGNHGAVHIWLGNKELTVEADFVWTGVNEEKFGFAVARIGDVNDDNVPDWAVGAPDSDEDGSTKGKVYVFYGNSDLSSITPVGIIGETGGDNFGYSISAAGDFNNDGVADFIVGAPALDVASPGRAGSAYVIYGHKDGVSTDLADATKLTGEFSNDAFGWSVTDAGDFLDGDDCVAVGAPWNDTHGGLDAGAVYVYEGDIIPDDKVDHEIQCGGIAPGSQYGFAVRGVGDWGGDTHTDLAIGGPFNNNGGLAAGRVEIVYGSASGPSTTGDRYVLGEVAGDNFGYSLDRIWDFTLNFADDVLVGAPFHNLPAANCGRAYIFEGGSLATSAKDLEFKGNVPMKPGAEANDHYGWAVASAGDFDGDGDWDLAVGAPEGNKMNDAVTGFIHLQDSSTDVVPSFFSFWTATWAGTGAADVVRLSFSFALSSDQFGDVQLFRQVRDGQGGLLDETAIWAGQAQWGQGEVPGILSISGDGFTYLDQVPVETYANAVSLSYSLNAVTGDGFVFAMESLDGPGDLSTHLNFGSLLALDPAWPNPANPAVTIRFRAAPTENISVRIMDLRGRLVSELYQGPGTGDWQHMIWNGRTISGAAAASGLYLIRLENGEKALNQRVVLAR
ncbi:MAG: FG-GAP repeat protein [Candidatus Krumholzibacteria bacterium]|nr:FG-GAP repeat protein [Candidatus Krumholzibacteria bacterium]